jgi:addiction module RelB/DinJ family antitoxin
MEKQQIETTDEEITIIIESKTKEEAEEIFKKLGLSLSEGIILFLQRVVEENGFPLLLD